MTLLLAMLLWIIVGVIAIALFGDGDRFETLALVVVGLLLIILILLGWPFLLYGIRKYNNQS